MLLLRPFMLRHAACRHRLLVKQHAPVLFASTKPAKQSRLAVLALVSTPRDVSVSARKRRGAPAPQQDADHDVQGPNPSAAQDPWAALGLDPRVTVRRRMNTVCIPTQQYLALHQVRLEEQDITAPSEVQIAAIPTILSGANTAVQCYTGSGKTLAYLLPILAMAVQRAEKEIEEAQAARPKDWAAHVGQVQAIVVAPSRELAMQIVRVAQSLLPPDAARAVQQAIGGANPSRQVEALRYHKPLVVVGTPGRLAELNRGGYLSTHKCGLLVLDEVDQLLAPHFRDEMARLHGHVGRKLPSGRQTVIVSATATPKVLEMAAEWCPEPTPVFLSTTMTTPTPDTDTAPEAPPPASTAPPQWGWGHAATQTRTRGTAGGVGTSHIPVALPPTLRHLYVETQHRHRVDTLRRAIHALDVQRALVFMNFQQRLADTQAKLSARGMPVGVLHGELTKLERASVLQAFKRGEFRALVVSDVATRGLDVPECDAVFNLELPSDAAHYAHRAGRTGRMGRAGVVVSIVEPSETRVVKKLTGAMAMRCWWAWLHACSMAMTTVGVVSVLCCAACFAGGCAPRRVVPQGSCTCRQTQWRSRAGRCSQPGPRRHVAAPYSTTPLDHHGLPLLLRCCCCY